MSESDLTRPILVIGLGNTLRGDDALGRLAAERLRQRVDPQRVAVIDLISPTPELAAEIAGADLVVFLDASIIGPVRQVVVQRLKAQDNDESLMHQCQPASLVRLAEELFGAVPEAYAITWRADTFDYGNAQLSADASVGCDQVVREALALIQGHRCRHECAVARPGGLAPPDGKFVG